MNQNREECQVDWLLINEYKIVTFLSTCILCSCHMTINLLICAMLWGRIYTNNSQPLTKKEIQSIPKNNLFFFFIILTAEFSIRTRRKLTEYSGCVHGDFFFDYLSNKYDA